MERPLRDDHANPQQTHRDGADLTQYERVCKVWFQEIMNKLETLDEAIRGNGQIGIKTRLEILERESKERKWLLRTIAAASITATFTLLIILFTG